VTPPEAIRGVTQSPIEGVSFAHSFDDATAPSKHVTQYFEMLGHRSIYHDGWRAVCPWPGTSFTEAGRQFGTPIPADTLTELDATGWELYDVDADPTETKNVAARNRPRLIEMIAQWYVEAGKYNVLPVDGRGQQRLAEQRPEISAARDRYVYFPGTQEVPANSAPRILNRPHTITALVEIPKGGAEGVLVSQGGVDGGFTFFVKDGKLRYTYNYVAERRFEIVSDRDVPAGRHALSFEFQPTGKAEPLKGKGTPGIAKLFVDGKPVGEGKLPVTIPIAMGLASGVSVGADAGAPVTDEYEPPFAFTGTIDRVVYDISGKHVVDHEAEIRMALARQ
jgi:arylsulfatase